MFTDDPMDNLSTLFGNAAVENKEAEKADKACDDRDEAEAFERFQKRDAALMALSEAVMAMMPDDDPNKYGLMLLYAYQRLESAMKKAIRGYVTPIPLAERDTLMAATAERKRLIALFDNLIVQLTNQMPNQG